MGAVCLLGATTGAVAQGQFDAAGREILVVVSRQSAVQTLDNDTVADLFLGAISRFPDGRGAHVIDQSDRQDIKRRFYAQVADMSLQQLRSHQARLLFSGRATPPRQAENSSLVAELVTRDPTAIGYIEPAALDDRLRVVLRISP